MKFYIASHIVPDLPKVKFTMCGIEYIAEATSIDDYWVYSFSKLSAQSLSDTITATIFYDDNIESQTIEKSVEDYLNDLANCSSTTDSMKTLIGDIVSYGQAAERVNGRSEGIKTITGCEESSFVLPETDYTSTKSKTLDGVKFKSVSLKYTYKNNIIVTFIVPSNYKNFYVTINDVIWNNRK